MPCDECVETQRDAVLTEMTLSPTLRTLSLDADPPSAMREMKIP